MESYDDMENQELVEESIHPDFLEYCKTRKLTPRKKEKDLIELELRDINESELY